MKLRSPYSFFNPSKRRATTNYLRLTSSQRRQPSAILKGVLNYNEAFAAFINGTNQKKDTALIIGSFIEKLGEKDISLLEQTPAKILDIGCADCSTGLRYLKNIHYPSGFNYCGVDINQPFLEEAKLKLSNFQIIKDYRLVQEDALSGHLHKRKEFASVLFNLIFVSHVAYYLKSERHAKDFLQDIIRLLSNKDGIAIFLHEDSTQYFRSTYNPGHFSTLTTPILLEKTAREIPTNYNQFKSISFTSKLHFSPLKKDLWEAAKHPEGYEDFAEELAFIETLEKLAFIVQRDLVSLANDGCLANYIDEIRAAIEDNDHCLDLETRMQIMVSPECLLRHKIARALKELEQEAPSLIGKNISEKFIDDSDPQAMLSIRK